MPRKGIMLCYPFEEKRLARWQAPYILQPKLDGDRCRGCIDSQGNVTLLSSEENKIISVPHINSALEALHLRNVEFDGELYIPGAPHETIHGIVSRDVNLHSDSSLVEFHIFDLVTSDLQVTRTTKLLDTIPYRKTGITFGPLQIVPVSFVTTIDGIMRQQERYTKDGYEGFVIRDSYAPYVRKRSTQMMKFKPRKEDIYEIISYQEEISKDGVPKGSLGALVCISSADTKETFSVGSGSLLTQDARHDLWGVRDSLSGKWARVKYQHLTHARGVPRFPVIIEIIDNALVKILP
uniref:Polydeoxyribonucleotide synthase [ATP] n=1 Tax=viral metagenome TaxID=1070528 RepID=A0A6M3KQQ2_9ZZZZ